MIPIVYHESESELVSLQFRVPIHIEEAEVIATDTLARVLRKNREVPRELPTMIFAKGKQ